MHRVRRFGGQMWPSVRIVGSVRPVFPDGPATRRLPVARDLGFPRPDPTAVRQLPDNPKALVTATTVTTTTTAATQQPSAPPPQHPPRSSAAKAVPVRLLHMQPGAEGTGHVAVWSHVLPEVWGRHPLQTFGVPQVRHAHAIPATRRRASQVVGRETVAGAVAGLRAAGRWQGLVQTGQDSLGPHKVQPGILHR